MGYQDFFMLKKATKLGKSGNSVQISLTHIAKEPILSISGPLFKKFRDIRKKIVTNLYFDFNFEYSITNYLSPKKLTSVLHFKKLKIKKLRDQTLYTEFKNVVEEVFKQSDFKIIQYKRRNNAIQITIQYSLISYDKVILYQEFDKIKDNFLVNSDKVKEIVSENSVIYIYRIEIIKRIYNIFDFGICKESRHLLIKYIKMLDLIPRTVAREMTLHKKEYVYLEFNSRLSIKKLDLRYFLSSIRDSDGRDSIIFLGKDKEKISRNDLWIWIPRQNELERIIFNTRTESVVEVIHKTKYIHWRKKHKISRKCEELNLLAYFMGKNYQLIWNKVLNRWEPKPPPPQDIFKINEYLKLKLEEGQTNIYVRGRLFNQCKFLLFSFTKDDLSDYDEINSIDEIKEKYDHSHEGRFRTLNPKVAFWGHCSNLQAWYENNYDTRILHSNLSFPLLKKLMQCGDPKAKQVIKEEIALRFESNFPNVIKFLLEEEYLFFLEFDEIETLSNNIDMSKWSSSERHRFLDQWHMKAIKSKDIEKVSQVAEKKWNLLGPDR